MSTEREIIERVTKDKIGSSKVRRDIESLDLGTLASMGQSVSYEELRGYLNNVPNKNNEKRPKY